MEIKEYYEIRKNLLKLINNNFECKIYGDKLKIKIELEIRDYFDSLIQSKLGGSI
jgi:hypothetical protein